MLDLRLECCEFLFNTLFHPAEYLKLFMSGTDGRVVLELLGYSQVHFYQVQVKFESQKV